MHKKKVYAYVAVIASYADAYIMYAFACTASEDQALKAIY